MSNAKPAPPMQPAPGSDFVLASQRSLAGQGAARTHSSVANVFRSLSTIHRSTSLLPASLLDLDLGSAGNIHVIRPETHPEAFVPIPPDGGWGWVIVFAAFFSNLIIDGICVSFGIMANDLVEHFNASVATVMLTGSLLMGVYMMVGPIVAGLVNKFGCRVIGVIGSVLATLAMFASSFMPTIELMLITYGVIAGAAFGFIHLPSLICVSFYFDSRRALATGLVSCGTPIGAMVFAPLTEFLLKTYGWQNTLILFAGMLLHCVPMAVLYRPLTPALILSPVKGADAEVFKSILQLTSAAENGDVVGGGDATPITSKENLQNQPLMEENEEDEEAAAAVENAPAEPTPQVQLETITEGPEHDEPSSDIKSGKSSPDGAVKPRIRHHRHIHHRSRGSKTPKTGANAALRHIRDQFALWRERIRQLRSKEEGEAAESDSGSDEEDDDDDDDDGSSASSYATCGSSCDEEASHSETSDSDDGDSDGGERSPKHEGAAAASTDKTGEEVEQEDEERDQLRPLVSAAGVSGGRRRVGGGRGGRRVHNKRGSRPPVPDIVVSGTEAETSGRSSHHHHHGHHRRKREERVPAKSTACILSTPNLGGNFSNVHKASLQQRSNANGPQRRPSRTGMRRIPRQSVVRLATAALPRRRTASVLLAQRPGHSVLGSGLFFSSNRGIHQSTTSGITDPPVLLDEMLEGAPVIVELPHESITIEDYARPMYRKDIFFPGSVKRQIESAMANAAVPIGNIGFSSEHIAASKASINIPDGIRHRKISTSGTAQFGSSILFGDNVPLPPIAESQQVNATPDDANWTGSCLMSLTKIPLPDVFKRDDTTVDQDEAMIWEKLKAETGLNLADAPADGIYRVPRSSSFCGWWLCWKTQRRRSLDDDEEMDDVERFKQMLMGVETGELRGDELVASAKFPAKAKMVLMRTCVFMPKSICDVLATMTNLSVLKSKSFAILCLANLIIFIGIYVPLFFVIDLASSFNIPNSQSSFLLTIYGGASTVSRFAASWAAGRPGVSAITLTTVTLLLAGASICVMPYWGSLGGQMAMMVVFGLVVSPFFSLTSIVLCDLLDLEALTNAYGIVTLVRGLAGSAGCPIAGMIVAATSTFSIAFIVSGGTLVVGGILLTLIIMNERAKLNKFMKASAAAEDV